MQIHAATYTKCPLIVVGGTAALALVVDLKLVALC